MSERTALLSNPAQRQGAKAAVAAWSKTIHEEKRWGTIVLQLMILGPIAHAILADRAFSRSGRVAVPREARVLKAALRGATVLTRDPTVRTGRPHTASIAGRNHR